MREFCEYGYGRALFFECSSRRRNCQVPVLEAKWFDESWLYDCFDANIKDRMG